MSAESPESVHAPTHRALSEGSFAVDSLVLATWEQTEHDRQYLQTIRDVWRDSTANYFQRYDKYAHTLSPVVDLMIKDADFFYDLYTRQIDDAKPMEKAEFLKFLEHKDFNKYHDHKDEESMYYRFDPAGRAVQWMVSEVNGNISGVFGLSELEHRLGLNSAEPLTALPPERQRDMIQLLYEEWKEYVALLDSHNYDIGWETRSPRPLPYNSLADLKAELADTEPALPVDMIFGYWNRTGRGFHRMCERSRGTVRRREYDRSHPSLARKPTVRERQLAQKADDMMSHPVYAKFISERKPMKALHVADTSQVNDVLIAEAGLFIEELAGVYGDSQGNIWGNGITKDIGAIIRPKNFWGKLDNTRLIHLPINQEFADTYVKGFDKCRESERELLARIGIFTDMYSTGRGKVGESFQEVIIHVRDPEDPERRQVDLSVRKNLSGDKAAAYLNFEAGNIAIHEEVRHLRNPLSGGSPSLGKRR